MTLDFTTYRVTYKYASTLGQMACLMSGSVVVPGADNVATVKEFLERNGVTEIYVEPFHAPVMSETFGKLSKMFNDFPIAKPESN